MRIYQEVGSAGLLEPPETGAIPKNKVCLSAPFKELSLTKGYPVERPCTYLKISRSVYYRWVRRPDNNSEIKNRRIRDELDVHYSAIPDFFGYGYL